jgi:hypothetical protein
MSEYRRIKYEDRCQIYALSKRGASQESIASILGSGLCFMRCRSGKARWRTKVEIGDVGQQPQRRPGRFGTSLPLGRSGLSGVTLEQPAGFDADCGS